jgi:hypothetical protein
MRTAKLLFAVRPKICARQRSKRTAIIIFPVVMSGLAKDVLDLLVRFKLKQQPEKNNYSNIQSDI